MRFTISPLSTRGRKARLGSGSGMADTSASVYGCMGAWNRSSTGPISTILPPYMTATRSQKYSTTLRSWAMNR